MSYEILIRGIPNFNHVFTEVHETIESFFSTVDVKCTNHFLLGLKLDFYRDGKRVIPYLSGNSVEPKILVKNCAEVVPKTLFGDSRTTFGVITINPEAKTLSSETKTTLSSGGTTSSIRPWKSEWYAILADRHPTAAAIRAEFEKQNKSNQEARRLAEELEEKRDRAICEALEDAVDRAGYEKVLGLLQSITKETKE